MAFTFYGYQPEKQYEQPLSNLVSNLLGGYTSASKAKYLQPQLEEELQKAKLYNKWYEPNIKSEIGLRGAQSGHLGAMTEGLNISNPYLRQKLEDEQTKRAFELQNPLLNHAGVPGQIGSLLYLQQHPELMKIPQQGMQSSENGVNNLGEGQYYMPSIMPQQGQPSESASNNPYQLLQQSILNSLKPKGNNTPLEKAQNYATEQEKMYGKDSEQVKIAKDYVDKLAHGTKKPKGNNTPLEKAQNYATEQEKMYGKDSEQVKIAKDYVDKLAHGTKKPKGNNTPLEKAQNYATEQEKMYGKDSEQVKIAKDYVDKLAHGTKSADFWNSLPVNAKSHMIAIGQGAGFSADETIRWLKSGKPLKDLVFQHGYKDENEVNPIYELTGSSQTQLQNRIFASKEADYLSKFIRNATGEYAGTVAGYSTKLLKDQLSHKNEEGQAKYLAARGLAPELGNLRLTLANAKSTVSAQNQLREKAMLDMKAFRTLVTPKVWGRMQEVMDDELQKMFKQARTGFGQKVSNAVSKSTPENDPLGIR